MMMGSLPTVIAIGRSSPRASARQLHGNVALRHGLNSDTVRALHHEPIAPDILHVVDVEAPSPRLRRNSGIRSKRLMSLQFSQGPAMPSPPLETASLLRKRRCIEEKLAHGDTPDPCTAHLLPGGFQNSAGVAAFRLGGPSPQTTATCVRFVTPNLRMICRT
jgi:hypothetical protein